MDIEASVVINAAGLQAPMVANRMEGLDPALVPVQYLAKGSYFALNGRSPFSRLVYPLPPAGGLGVHLTLDLAGQARFGPDVEWVSDINYQVDPSRAQDFYASIRHYWPALPNGTLLPGYSGIRPKLSGPGMPARDFMIQTEKQHGVHGLINLFGIESPGLTSALAIAERVQALV
jgi:L-2-hydroxyglutarate oxidase LhgO